MGAGPIKRKSVQNRLRELRAAKAAPALVWVPTPGWVLGPNGAPDILLPIDDRTGKTDEAALATITRAEYVAAMKAAVETGDFGRWYLERDEQERSWARFLDFRDGEHAVGCSCSPECVAKRPEPPSRPTARPAVEM